MQICECGHVGGIGADARQSQHLNGFEACLAPDCDCEAFDAIIDQPQPVVIDDPKATAIVVAGKALLDAANALQLADFGYLADYVVQVQRLLNGELVQRIRASKSTTTEVAP